MATSPETLMAVLGALRDRSDSHPSAVAEESADLYQWIRLKPSIGLFDERDYFLGETALLAGGAHRLLGNVGEAERWLDRADAGFRHTVNPSTLHAKVAYARLALRFSTGRYEDVLELVPSLTSSFERFGMAREAVKCRFLAALTLKQLGKLDDAFELLTELEGEAPVQGEPAMHGQVLVHLGDHLGAGGQVARATALYERALPLLQSSNRPFAVAELKWSLGSTYRAQGALGRAAEAFRSAREGFETLGMRRYVAFVQLALAEALIAAGRPREAEWEILQALPTIEEQKMVPEGFAAVALLRESVKRRKADPNALRELREHLQKQN